MFFALLSVIFPVVEQLKKSFLLHLTRDLHIFSPVMPSKYVKSSGFLIRKQHHRGSPRSSETDTSQNCQNNFYPVVTVEDF